MEKKERSLLAAAALSKPHFPSMLESKAASETNLVAQS
jgi:hypothetical protein